MGPVEVLRAYFDEEVVGEEVRREGVRFVEDFTSSSGSSSSTTTTTRAARGKPQGPVR